MNKNKHEINPTKNNSRINESYEKTKEEYQQEMIDNLNRDNIHRYLRNLQITSYTDQMANRITKQSAQKFVYSIKNGLIEIPRNRPSLPESAYNSQKLSKQEARQLEKKLKRQNIVKKIEYLYDQIRGQSPKQGDKQGHLQVQYKQILTKEQHERKVREIVQQKLERKKRLQQLQEQQALKMKQQQQKKQALKKIEQQKQKQHKRIKIQQKIQKRKQQHDKFIEMQLNLHSEMIKIKNKTRLYEQMQKRYNSQIVIPSLQQKKNKLKQIRDFHKRYDVQTIKQHQKQYLQKSLQKLQQKSKQQNKWKYNPPFRTQRLTRLLKDQQIQWKQKLEQKKRKNEQMLKRQQNFKIELKQKYRPKIDDDKKKQIEIRLINQQRKQQKIHPNIDHRRIGQAYLEIAKQMKRSGSVKQSTNQKIIQLKQKQSNEKQHIYHDNQFYQNIRRKKIQNIVNSQIKTVSQKWMMLKMQDQKLIEKFKQRQQLCKIKNDSDIQNEAAQYLLSSLKAKMSMIDLLKKNQDSQQSSDQDN